jgi:hypothetical protein
MVPMVSGSLSQRRLIQPKHAAVATMMLKSSSVDIRHSLQCIDSNRPGINETGRGLHGWHGFKTKSDKQITNE